MDDTIPTTAGTKRTPLAIAIGIAWRVVFFTICYNGLAVLYGYCHDRLQLSDFHLIVTVTELIMIIPFWAANAILTVVDTCQFPHWLYQYKLQKNVAVGWRTHAKVIAVVACNQLFLSVPTQTMSYPLYKARGMSTARELPQLSEVVRDLVLMILVEEILFYYSHRLMHVNEWLYRHVHSMHHQLTAPVGTASMYAHPIEFLFSNVLPIMAGPLIFGCHVYSMWLWLLFAVLSTINGHSGYAFPFTPFGPAKLHDLHHATYQSNYGAIGLCDWLHSTRKWDAPLYHATVRISEKSD